MHDPNRSGTDALDQDESDASKPLRVRPRQGAEAGESGASGVRGTASTAEQRAELHKVWPSAQIYETKE